MAISFMDINKIKEYSVFNETNNYQFDNFIEFQDISAEELPLIEELQELIKKNNKTSNELTKMNELSNKFRDKMPTSTDWNKFCACLLSMQVFIKNKVDDYVFQIDFKGLYNSKAPYKKFNFVRYNEEVYMCLKDNVGQLPDANKDTLYWSKTSSKGEKGDKGDPGVNLAYRDNYSEEVQYNINDLVKFNNSLYKCYKQSKGNIPTNEAYFAIFLKGSVNIVTDKNQPTKYSGGDLWFKTI